MAMSHRDRLLAVAVVNPALHRLRLRDTLSSVHDGPLLGLQLLCTVYCVHGARSLLHLHRYSTARCSSVQ